VKLTYPDDLRMTKQRQVILDELQKLTSHPTADEMYQLLRKRLPKISLGTVYRNLEIMSENGLIQKLDVGGTQKRFDGNAETHYHVRCARCNRVDNINIMPDRRVEEMAQAHTDYEILRHRMEFIGYCPACQSQIK